MRVPLSWLGDFAPIEVPVDELAALLGDLGLAVESVEHVGGGLDGVVVARVLEIAPIEGADRIRAVQVDMGAADPVPVVCGAWNFEVGDLVPLATVGTVLPTGMAIARRKMRGVESAGMLCSPDEVGLPGGSHDGLLVLPAGLVPGTPFADATGLGPDVVFDLEVNPNRPDAMCVAGVARDLAARLGLPFAVPEPVTARLEAGAPVGEAATVEVEATDLCGRFVARVLRGVRVGPSGPLLAGRLAKAGMRAITNVVDVSNYVMLELGVPNHAYDLGRLAGRGLRVRRARAGESLVTLDGVERPLTPDDCLICDATDEPVGIAGVMGGASSEISPETTDVLLEAAWWRPTAIARTSRRLGLRTEASARFERGTDPDALAVGAARFCELLGVEVAPGALQVEGDLPERRPVRLRTSRVNALLGTSLTVEDVRGHLASIGFGTTPVDGDTDVLIPPWRPDSAIEVDLVEEVARMAGYAALPRRVPKSPLIGGLTPAQTARRSVRAILCGTGTSEAWTTTFLSEEDLERCGLDPADAVRVVNPLVAEESLLRPSLLPGLAAALAHNARHRRHGVRLFEIGTVFRAPAVPVAAGGPSDGSVLPDQREVLAVALGGAEAPAARGVWDVLAEGLGLRGAGLEVASAPGLHRTRSAACTLEGESVGVLGEVDPGVLAALEVPERVAWLEVDLAAVLAAVTGAEVPQLAPVSRYPSSDVDLAFEVDEAAAAASVEATLRAAGGDLVAELRLFDVYRGDQVADGRRSLAWTVRLQADDRTLTDAEVAEARRRLVESVEAAHPASLRG